MFSRWGVEESPAKEIEEQPERREKSESANKVLFLCVIVNTAVIPTFSFSSFTQN